MSISEVFIINLKEIANSMGVSISTVSLVLNQKPGVNAETRKQISEVLLKNGYVIKPAKQEQTTLGVITFIRYIGAGRLLEPNDEFFTKILAGAEEQARSCGYQLMLSTAYPHTFREILSELTPSKTSGILFLGSEFPPSDAALLLEAKVPLVSIDSLIHDNLIYAAVNSIDVENNASVFTAIHHLYQQGHRQIGYLSSTETTGSIPLRAIAYRNSMEQLGLSIDPRYMISLDLFVETTYQQFRTHLETSPPLPTAFFADKDTIAVGCMKAMQEVGIRIPHDISMIGFDNSYVCKIATPLLTTMDIPRLQLGKAAANRLFQLISGDTTVVKTSFATPMVQRGSTAPPHKRNQKSR